MGFNSAFKGLRSILKLSFHSCLGLGSVCSLLVFLLNLCVYRYF